MASDVVINNLSIGLSDRAVMEPLRCEACGAIMRKRKEWLYRCEVCGFLASTLQPGAGTGVGGLEKLRRRNFEIMLDRLDKIRPVTSARILEVESAQGWFLEAASRRGAKIKQTV